MVGENREKQDAAQYRPAAALLGAWGLYQLLIGSYFMVIRPSFLPEDLRVSATTLAAVRGAAPGIEAWLQWVFAVMGGQMAALGVVLMGGAFDLVRGRRPGWVALGVYVAAGLLSVTLMSAANFAFGSDFRWFLVAPVVLWLGAMIVLGGRFGQHVANQEGAAYGNRRRGNR